MDKATDLSAIDPGSLAAILQETMDRIDTLTRCASEKFKQSEAAEWDEDLYGKGRQLLAEVEELVEQNGRIAEELERRIDPSVLEELMRKPDLHRGDREQRWHRKDLTTRTVPTSADIDDLLPQSVDNLIAHVPGSWWRDQQSRLDEQQRSAVLQPLILYGRERWGTGYQTLHKYASYLAIAKSHLLKEPLLDMFSAARAIPSICYLGMSLDLLKAVKGAPKKLRELCRAPSGETDARIYELLVAAAFTRLGHDVEFITTTTTSKTPDLRLHGEPFPIVIECKRRQALNAYEVKEFAVIRCLFDELCAEREKLGLIGELSIDFQQEITGLSVSSIMHSIREMTKSLVPYATQETDWGTIHLKPVSVSQTFEPTRLYSPDFLEKVFKLDLELDEFDGICVVVKNDRAPIVDRAELPFLLKWASNSGPAKQKKTQTIKNLWIEAVEQIPTGEGGLIYLAYEEGHRPSLADARTDAIRQLVGTIYFKRRAISVLMTVITRLLPNVVLEGRPDLIESVIPLVAGDKESFDFWTAEMPTRIFTP